MTHEEKVQKINDALSNPDLEKLAAIAEAGLSIYKAARLNNVTVDEILAICTGMAVKYEREKKVN